MRKLEAWDYFFFCLFGVVGICFFGALALLFYEATQVVPVENKWCRDHGYQIFSQNRSIHNFCVDPKTGQIYLPLT